MCKPLAQVSSKLQMHSTPSQYACSHLLPELPVIAGCETSDISAVMDGKLDDFISQYLRHKSKQQQEARLAAPT